MTDRYSVFKTPEGESAFMKAYDAILALWPVPFTAMYLPTRFGRTHLIACGREDAPPLVLLSGAGTSATIWYENVAGLSREFRIYALDTVGDAGKSSLSMDRPVRTRRECAEWLAGVLDALGVERASVAGISYGGWLAMNFSLLAPGRVDKAVLIAPGGVFVPLGQMFYRVYFSIVLLPFLPVVRNVLSKLSTRKDAGFERWAGQMAIAVRHCRLRIARPVVLPDHELAACKAPVLLLIGEQEPLYDYKAAIARAERLVPRLRAEVIPGAGHVVNIDQPEKVNESIISFIKQ